LKKEVREIIWNKYGRKCSYCGEDLEYSKMEVDHIHPKYLGGADDIENLTPSCKPCNFYKSTFSVDGFRQQLFLITARIQKSFIVRLAAKYGIISFKPFSGVFYFEKVLKKHNDKV
jgi:hypothetical protein